MSRISYSDEEEVPGQFALWQANCRRSLDGKKGQAALRELEAALLALPDKRLIAGKLIDGDGEVCALGALAQYKGHALVAEKVDDDGWDEIDLDGEMEDFGVELGLPRLVAWKVVCLNDIEIDGHYETLAGPIMERYDSYRMQQFIPATPEERFEKILAWVQRKIQPPESAEGGNTVA